MNPLALARWQFGITTVYHFLFVPLTIGLSLLVAVMQTAWYRTGKPQYLRMTKFWGKLFLINFAMGVVTGIVQEFQFGMNWSDYSRFVGDVFGAPLAMEALLAFFLESTFLGLWIFGWDKLPKRVHLLTMWCAAIGSTISAYFILAANSFMQHPVGYTIDAAKHRAELTRIWAVLGNSTTLVTFPHTIFASLLTGGVFVIAVSAWHLRRNRDLDVFRPSLKLALVATVLAGAGLGLSGDIEAKIMTDQQPMKMAAAEALYQTSKPASFSLFTIGSLNGHSEVFSIRVPHLLSFLATGSLNGKVDGIDNLQQQYVQQYGPGDYRPLIAVTYWSFRFMIGFGMIAALLALVGLWLIRRGRSPTGRRFYTLALWSLPLPFLANSLGWIFTEMGRQPWLVFGRLKTEAGVSPSVSGGDVLTSLIVLTALYGVLAIVDVVLMVRFAKAGPPAAAGPDEAEPDPSSPTEGTPMHLHDFWFLLIAVLWSGYFLLEGFDFGVGVLLPFVSRDDIDRRLTINTIGPVWDGNEVWLLTAGGATFAAFPEWYASLFSGFYLALLLILVALIIRGVAFEFRSKDANPQWRAAWDKAIFWGSAIPALLWGVAFANIVRGVPLNAAHDYTGTFFTLLNPYALLGGVTTLSLFTLHGAIFLALKTTGEVRTRANLAVKRVGPVAVVAAAGFLVWTEASYGKSDSAVVAVLAALALVGAIVMSLRGREGWAFALNGTAIVAAVAALFLALYPNVLPSTSIAAGTLTVTNASSTQYTLTVMSWVALIFTPVVLGYQAWTYWVFRKRLGRGDIPGPAAAADIAPAVVG